MPLFVKSGDEFSINDILLWDFIVLSVSKENVKSLNLAPASSTIHKFECCGTFARGKLAITFEYDDDPREIFEIEEIRKWVKALFERHPHFFYFITPFADNVVWLAACLGDTKIVEKDAQKFVEIKINPDICRRIVDSIKQFGDEIGEDEGGLEEVFAAIPCLEEFIKSKREE